MGIVKLLKASAGSGKTYQLAYEYIRAVINEPMQYRHILAVTFTNKATEEMKSRILAEINDLAEGRQSNYLKKLSEELSISEEEIKTKARLAQTKILHDYNRFAILTIDKFFQRIIRSFIKELGIDLNFNLELQTDSLLSSAADALIDDISLNLELRQWIVEFIEEKIEEGKRWDIKSGLSSLGYELFKEQYHQAKIETSKEKLAEIVASTSRKVVSIKNDLQNKAKKALDIMQDHNLSINDFSNKATGVAGYLYKVANGDFKPYGARVIKALELDEGWYVKTSPRIGDLKQAVPTLRPILIDICSTYDNNINFINSTELLRENYRNFALLNDLSKKIEELCAEQSIMPISNTNYILNKLISGNEAPFIFEKTGNHFTHFMIDEFQDTSTMQWKNFLPLLKNAISQSEENEPSVLLVGDIKQSIYRWRGGDWKILAKDIEKEFGEILTIDLTTNFRSYSNIINFNNAMIASSIEIDNENLNNLLDSAYSSGFLSNETKSSLYNLLKSAYTNHNQDPTETKKGGYINITTYSEDENGTFTPPIISRIEQLQERGYAPEDIAILVRDNKEGKRIANLLLNYKSCHPDSKYSYNVISAEALVISASAAVGFILACLKMAVGVDKSINLAIYNNWINKGFDAKLCLDDEHFIQSLKTKSIQEAFEAVVSYYNLHECTSELAYIQAFHEQAINFSNTSIGDISLFVKWWDEIGSKQSIYISNESSSIAVTTIHKSKGLQYKVVVIPYCNWNLNPKSKNIIWASGDGDNENQHGFLNLGTIPVGLVKKMGDSFFSDEYYKEMVLSHIDNINIFYVALTRAEEELHLMIPSKSSKKITSGIDSLINEAVHISGEEVSIANIQGKLTFDSDSCKTYEFGTPFSTAQSTKRQENTVSINYLSYPISERLKLKSLSKRYLEEGITDLALSPRHFGILMHQVFEMSKDMEDVKSAIGNMVDNGIITDEEAFALSTKTEEAFNNPLVSSWFDGSWDKVLNENDIILPGIVSTKRPDRVMINKDHVVIVDYKFGLNRKPSYQKQLKEYMTVLSNMGYSKIEGYIWYVSLNDVETVD